MSPVDTAEALLADPDYGQLKEWIIAATGLSYYADKDPDLAGAVLRSLDPIDSGYTVPGILKLLARPGSATLDRLVEELTIGETFFFRHLEMFHALRDHVFPQLLQRRSALRSLRIWSAGCSVGAEPYSIAILLRDLLGAEADHWSIQIVGTDINRRFLAMARAGVYDSWALRGMPPALLERVFQKVGKRWQLNEDCRRSVVFRHHNLVADKFPSIENDLSGLDLIICRNVIIYFEGETIRRLTDQFFRSLVPGGWLAVGHAEPHTETFRAFRTVNTPGAVLYQRPESASSSQPQVSPATSWLDEMAKSFLKGPGAAAAAPATAVKPNPDPELSPGTVSSVPVAKPTGESLGLDEIHKLADCGELEAACQACEGLTLREPLHEGGHFYLGLLYFQLGDWGKAGRSLKRSLYLKRDLAVGHYYLGLVQLSLGQEALRSFRNAQKIVRRQPDESPLLWGDGLTAGELRALLAPYLGEAIINGL